MTFLLFAGPSPSLASRFRLRRSQLLLHLVYSRPCSGELMGTSMLREQYRAFGLRSPRAYALNPLLWPLSFHLIRKVERLLLSNNARRCDWKTYFEGRADAE
jgi:hypothetical protein